MSGAQCRRASDASAQIPRRALLIALATVALATTPGCGPRERAAPRPPNLLLISIDALRADRLEAYGYDRPTSPFLAELGEHGGFLHRDLLYDELLRVPLILVAPGVAPGRPDEPVSSVDIAPTLLELAAAPVPETMEGASLLRARRRGAVVAQYGDARYAVRTRDWKLIWSSPGTLELFDLRADPGEQRNVAAEHPEESAALAAAIERFRERHRAGTHAGPPVELTPAEWRELESLGYLR